MNALRLLVVLVGVVASIATSRAPESAPAPDDCVDPTTTGAIRVEIGAADEDVFRPLEAEELAELETGAQGFTMLPLRFRVTGLAEGCVSHETRISTCDPGGVSCDPDDRDEIARSVTPLFAYAEPGDAIATVAHFIVLEREAMFEAPVFIETRVAGEFAQIMLWQGAMGTLPATSLED